MNNIDHRTAQIDLDDKLFPHYLLGRQLAMELALKAMVQALPPKKIAEIAANIQREADIGMSMLQNHPAEEDTQDHVARCGLVCALLQMGF